MLQCPFCLVVGLEGDRACYKCGRPYRPGLDPKDILAEIGADVPGKFDADCFYALKNAVSGWNGSMPGRLASKPKHAQRAAVLPALSLAS